MACLGLFALVVFVAVWAFVALILATPAPKPIQHRCPDGEPGDLGGWRQDGVGRNYRVCCRCGFRVADYSSHGPPPG